jgi:hypothetical protein
MLWTGAGSPGSCEAEAVPPGGTSTVMVRTSPVTSVTRTWCGSAAAVAATTAA